MGDPKNLHFCGFGTFGRVPEPQNQLFVFQNHWNVFKLGNRKCCRFGKRPAPKIPADPSNQILKILDVGQISMKNMNGNLVIWNQYLLKALKDFQILKS